MPDNGPHTTREAYAFACLTCGYGWEQEYAIEHHTDPHGRPFVVYRVDGHQVPSPLTRPTCQNCGAHRVRVLRSGLVAAVERVRGLVRPPA